MHAGTVKHLGKKHLNLTRSSLLLRLLFSEGFQPPHPTGPSNERDDGNCDKAFHPSGNNGEKNHRTDELDKKEERKMNKSS